MLTFQKTLSIILLTLLALSIAPTNSQAQGRVDVLHLKNGSVIRGVIIEQIPDVSIKIRTADGSEFVYEWDQVEKIVSEAATTPTQGTSAAPEDAVRDFKGFLIGFGLGGGVTTLSIADCEFCESETKPAVMIDFKIGAGLKENLALYFFSKPAVISFADSDVMGISGSAGLGASMTVASSLNVNGGIGLATYSESEDSSSRSADSGMSLVVGVEYEFSKHWFFDIDLLLGSAEVRATSIKATINWLHY